MFINPREKNKQWTCKNRITVVNKCTKSKCHGRQTIKYVYVCLFERSHSRKVTQTTQNVNQEHRSLFYN